MGPDSLWALGERKAWQSAADSLHWCSLTCDVKMYNAVQLKYDEVVLDQCSQTEFLHSLFEWTYSNPRVQVGCIQMNVFVIACESSSHTISHHHLAYSVIYKLKLSNSENSLMECYLHVAAVAAGAWWVEQCWGRTFRYSWFDLKLKCWITWKNCCASQVTEQAWSM